MSFHFLAYETSDPNRPLRIERNTEYPKYTWYIIGSFLGIVALCHLVNLAILSCRRYQPRVTFDRVEPEKDVASERSASVVPTRISFRRLPVAALNAYRIFAFRTTVPVGSSHSINFAEITVMAAYIGMLFILTFINCKISTLRLNGQ